MSPSKLDVAVIRRHRTALDAALQNLRRHAGKPPEALASDLDATWAVERGLQPCAQNALDLAMYLAASAGRDVSDYAGAIDVLGELGVLSAEFAARFRGVAGFRNVLVHGYLDVDRALVHTVLNERLGDFAEFARLVEAHLASA